MNVNIALANTYVSYNKYKINNGEIAFVTETDTNRQSRDKLSPPRIRYTEWYLATTRVSNNVTIYTKSTRTDESWYMPDVLERSMPRLNDLIYFPENTNLEIVENRKNSMSFDQDGDITQIVGATFTWTTDSDDLTRSTTSNFIKILETKGGLEKMTNPKTAKAYLANSGRYQTIFGGNNAYDENGAILLKGNCTLTVYDIDGGSTLLTNNPSGGTLDTISTLKKGAGMLSFDVNEAYIAKPHPYKNNYMQTSRLRPGFQQPTFTSPTSTYQSYSYYYSYYY